MKIIENNRIFAFDGKNEPVAEVMDGETIIFRTHDCFDNQLSEEGSCIGALNWNRINPATGPVYIENAKAGDVLKVEILEITLDKQGVMCALPENGVLGSLVKEESVKRIQVEEGKVHFNDKLVFDVMPMIGVIGVAPENGSINCGTPGCHGGNMDNKRIKEGASLYFPVFHDGALFSLGDVHAAMGDGEVMVSGVEISADVKVRLSVMKGIRIETPMLENEELCGVIYSHEEIEKAVFHAVRIMNERVQENLGLSFSEAGMLLSAVGDLRFCQVVDPKRTVMMCVPKKIMKGLF
ncbi:acetamidase/formamidase family protein [Oribacterium asaccharolyticum]|uniref:acetamidase/formamidase family protein n=1 Tax=Oribacterium asaccharolyticum TaxID=1501332 RepID=UPI0028EF929F|nr:acetamidase/formamidase family protein [Oribacterium asaccharolyticum]